MTGLLQDLRASARGLARRPGLAAVATLAASAIPAARAARVDPMEALRAE